MTACRNCVGCTTGAICPRRAAILPPGLPNGRANIPSSPAGREHRRDADLLSPAAPAPQAPQINQHAGALKRENQTPHPCRAHLPQRRELLAAGAGPRGRDPRELARTASLPQHGRSARTQKGGAAARSMTGIVPTRPSLAPCSPPSRPLRAACGGGLRPVLTAAVRGVTLNLGRDEETAPLGSNKETTPAARPFCRILQTQLQGC